MNPVEKTEDKAAERVETSPVWKKSSPVVCTGVDNKYVGKSKRDLHDIQLRLLNEIANYRLDSKRARQRLESARSCLASVRHDLALLEQAMRLETVVQFPAPYMDVEPVLEVGKADKEKTQKTG